MEAAWSRTRLSSRVEDEDLQHALADPRCFQAARSPLIQNLMSRETIQHRGLLYLRLKNRLCRSCYTARASYRPRCTLLVSVRHETQHSHDMRTSYSAYRAHDHEGDHSAWPARNHPDLNQNNHRATLFAEMRKAGCSYSSCRLHSCRYRQLCHSKSHHGLQAPRIKRLVCHEMVERTLL